MGGTAPHPVNGAVRVIVEPGEPALAELVEHFGERILAEDGSLDRAGLAAIAFTDEEQRATLNAITHPRIGEQITARLQVWAGGRGRAEEVVHEGRCPTAG